MDDQAGYHVLLQAAGIQLAHLVAVHVRLQHRGHRLAELLLSGIPGEACRLLGLGAVHAEDALHQAADEVVLQRLGALLTDVLLLRHRMTVVVLDEVAPLVAIVVPLRAAAVLTELLHAEPVVLGLHDNVEAPVIVLLPPGIGDGIHIAGGSDPAHPSQSGCRAHNSLSFIAL